MKIKNPKLSVTINEGAYISQGHCLDSSNHVHFTGTKYESTEFIAIKCGDVFVGAIYEPNYIAVSDLVNCTADAENGVILITDPTKDASCTVVLDSPS